MIQKNKIILSLALSLLFIGTFTTPVQAVEKLKIGQECGPGDNNDRCYTGDCEEGNNGKWYCDCDDDNDCSNPEEGYGTQPGEQWKCIDGGDATKDNDYCESNLRVKYPHGTTNKASTWDMLTDQTLAADEIKKMTSKPNLKISIPGLTFSEPKVIEDASGTYLSISSLAEFIKAAYRYGLSAAGIFAVVMIINAGFLWTRSGGNAEVITAQKKTIEKAIIGLIIAVSSYTILYFINPNLTKFDSLKVQYIKTEPILVDAAGDPPTMGPATAEAGSNGVPYFAQWKGPWAQLKPGDPEWPYKGAGDQCATIHKRGCGPTSLAMVLAYYGEPVSPLDTGRWALGCQGAWQAYGTLSDFSNRWPKLKMEIMNKKQKETAKTKILQLLSENKPLVYNCAPCQGYTSGGIPAKEYKGHYVVLTGIHPDNKNYQGLSDDKIFVTVNDPGRNENGRIMSMTMSQVLQNFVVAIYVYKK